MLITDISTLEQACFSGGSHMLGSTFPITRTINVVRETTINMANYAFVIMANPGFLTAAKLTLANGTISGGQRAFRTAASLSLMNISIANCDSTGLGCAIYATNGGEVSFNNVTITNCKSAGGAVVIDSGVTFSCVDSNFTGNTSTSEAAALYLVGSCNISGTNFNNNTASNYGAVRINSSTATFTGCSFDSNTATVGYGGAVGNFGATSFDGCSFINNKATNDWNGDGGAIYNSYKCSISNTILSRNSAAHSAGAILSANESYPSEVELVIEHCDIMYNEATSVGGAIVNGSKTSITECNIINNTAHDSYVGGGGIITNSESGTVSFNGGTINIANNLPDNMVFQYHTAGVRLTGDITGNIRVNGYTSGSVFGSSSDFLLQGANRFRSEDGKLMGIINSNKELIWTNYEPPAAHMITYVKVNGAWVSDG